MALGENDNSAENYFLDHGYCATVGKINIVLGPSLQYAYKTNAYFNINLHVQKPNNTTAPDQKTPSMQSCRFE